VLEQVREARAILGLDAKADAVIHGNGRRRDGIVGCEDYAQAVVEPLVAHIDLQSGGLCGPRGRGVATVVRPPAAGDDQRCEYRESERCGDRSPSGHAGPSVKWNA
jgi:hypothetical protein